MSQIKDRGSIVDGIEHSRGGRRQRYEQAGIVSCAVGVSGNNAHSLFDIVRQLNNIVLLNKTKD